MSDNPDTCVTDFRWMNIQSAGLGDQFNGIWGLNADPKAMEGYSDHPPADSYISDLFDDGIIEDKVFAIALRDINDDGSSYIDIGFYDESAMHNPADLLWVPVADDYLYGQFWW